MINPIWESGIISYRLLCGFFSHRFKFDLFLCNRIKLKDLKVFFMSFLNSICILKIWHCRYENYANKQICLRENFFVNGYFNNYKPCTNCSLFYFYFWRRGGGAHHVTKNTHIYQTTPCQPNNAFFFIVFYGIGHDLKLLKAIWPIISNCLMNTSCICIRNYRQRL